MQLLLGLFFFFSILLTTGSSLECTTCLAINAYCSDIKQECHPPQNVCMSFVVKSEDKTPIQVIMKNCAEEKICKQYKDLIGKPAPVGMPQAPPGAIIKHVTCSKAPPSFSSFFPAFLGLLLMKLLS